MSQIRLFKVFILSFFFCISSALDIKPDNNNNIVKINIDNKNRTYYHLKKNEEIEYSFLDKGIKKISNRHSVKFVSRTLIASNSNSNKIFGIEVSIYENDILTDVRNLEFNKQTSDAKSDSKPGWNYTKAGFWFEELDNLENSKVKIKLLHGSPEVAVKVIINEIKFRTSKSELEPITMNEEFIVQYKTDNQDTSYKNSDNWFLLSENIPLQYKISGPKIIRFISRSEIKNENLNQNYSFILREDGKFISKYTYEPVLSESEALIKDSENFLSGYNSSFYNIPLGIHYYTFFFENENNNNIYLKLEQYEDKK